MLERLGVDARRVMAAAETQAGDLGSPVVGCAHLLLALVDSGVAGPVLAYPDVRGAVIDQTAERARPSSIRTIGSGRRSRLPYGAPLLDVLRAAWRMSVVEKGTTVDPPHLLAALVKERPSDVVRILGDLGVTLDELTIDRIAARRRTMTFRPVAGAAVPADHWDDDDEYDDEPAPTVRRVNKRKHPSVVGTLLGRAPLQAVTDDVDLRAAPAPTPSQPVTAPVFTMDLVCPRCDDDFDPVLVDFAVDGREIEALACPGCRSLITAWPA